MDLPVSPARAGWWAALVAVPLALAGVALVWPGVPVASPAVAAPMVAGTAPTAAVPTAPAPDHGQRAAGELASILAGTPITFAADRPELSTQDAGTVARVAAVLRDTPTAAVRVLGYCADTPGSIDVTQRLSEQRAAAVADALVAAGVERPRLTTVGRGAADPLATPAASRRVEIQVL